MDVYMTDTKTSLSGIDVNGFEIKFKTPSGRQAERQIDQPHGRIEFPGCRKYLNPAISFRGKFDIVIQQKFCSIDGQRPDFRSARPDVANQNSKISVYRPKRLNPVSAEFSRTMPPHRNQFGVHLQGLKTKLRHRYRWLEPPSDLFRRQQFRRMNPGVISEEQRYTATRQAR